MQSAAEYLRKTESAVRKLFEGIESYAAIITRAPQPVHVSSARDKQEAEAQFQAWAEQNDAAIRASLKAQRDYFAESFALATLCGSVLQVAAKALEKFSTNIVVPEEWTPVVRSKHARYCLGRIVRRVPLGLIIFAGRNQHMHFGEERLWEPNVTVFERLAIYWSRNTDPGVRDPAFDLANPLLVSFAHNITALVGWRSYDAYESDLKTLLEPSLAR